MSDTSDVRLEELERQVRRLRRLLLGLALGFASALLLGAASQPEELTLKRLAIVDGQGRERIVAGTDPNDGWVQIAHRDADGALRIVAGTLPGGEASTQHIDSGGEKRITLTTFPDGLARAVHFDPDGQWRVSVATRPDGLASIEHFDRDGEINWQRFSR